MFLPCCVLSFKKVLRLDHNKLSWIPNDVGELSHIRELTIHDNPLGVDLLEFSDLDSVLAYFRLQPVPSEYRKSLRALKKLMGDAPKTEGDAIKDSKIHVFKALLADNRGTWVPFLIETAFASFC
jgi:hypothetical protein